MAFKNVEMNYFGERKKINEPSSVCVQVKLWRLCDPELEQPSEPEVTLHPGQGRLELVVFHPTSSGLLAVSTTKSPLIWDTSRQDAPLAGSCSWHHKLHVYTV